MDALGNPVHFLLTGGNIFDASAAIDLLSEVNISGSNILGDKAYGTKSIRTYITEQRASYTIPPKSNVIEPWFCDFHTYKERHLIECFFNKLKVFRRVATRYDMLQQNPGIRWVGLTYKLHLVTARKLLIHLEILLCNVSGLGKK